MSTFFRSVGSNFSNPLIPKLEKDSMINNGTLYVFDFKNNNSFPLQANAPAGTPIINLVTGGINGSVTSGSSVLNFENGGLMFPGNSASVIGFPSDNDFNLSALNPNFYMTIWVKVKSTDFSTSPFTRIIGRYSINSNADLFQFAIESGAAGVRPRAIVSTESAAVQVTDAADITKDVVVQLGLSYEGTTVKKYINGGVVATFPLARGTRLGNPTTGTAKSFLIGGSSWKGVIYRTVLENTTVSGKSCDAQVLADYTKNNTRFS